MAFRHASARIWLTGGMRCTPNLARLLPSPRRLSFSAGDLCRRGLTSLIRDLTSLISVPGAHPEPTTGPPSRWPCFFCHTDFSELSSRALDAVLIVEHRLREYNWWEYERQFQATSMGSYRPDRCAGGGVCGPRSGASHAFPACRQPGFLLRLRVGVGRERGWGVLFAC